MQCNRNGNRSCNQSSEIQTREPNDITVLYSEKHIAYVRTLAVSEVGADMTTFSLVQQRRQAPETVNKKQERNLVQPTDEATTCR